MRKYLLDTHTLVWTIVDESKLSKTVLGILQDEKNELFVSTVSFWEIAIKYAKGKLYLENFQIRNISDYCERLDIKQIPLMSEDTIYYSELLFSEEHKDPFDRMLICKSIRRNYTLVSKDSKMKIYEANGLKHIW